MLTVPISAVPMFPVNFFQNFCVVSYFANLCQKLVLCDNHSGCRKTMEQLLGYIRDEILPSYIGIIS